MCAPDASNTAPAKPSIWQSISMKVICLLIRSVHTLNTRAFVDLAREVHKDAREIKTEAREAEAAAKRAREAARETD